MRPKTPAYVIVSPVRNEARHIEKTLASVTAQTHPPNRWVIVDDSSTDLTVEIIQPFAAEHPFIELVQRAQRPDECSAKDRIARAAPPRAFNYGLRALAGIPYDFIVKLDGDLSFDPDYFEQLIEEFQKNPRLGIAGGAIRELSKGAFIMPWIPEDHVRGATKMYRRACFEQIDGVEEVLGWDTIDELKARMCGWETRSFKHISLHHWRPTGSATGIIRGKVRHGFTSYYLGYHPLYALARSVRRLNERPYVIGSIAMLYGYARGYLGRYEQLPDKHIRDYMQAQQLKNLKKLARNALVERDLTEYKAS